MRVVKRFFLVVAAAVAMFVPVAFAAKALGIDLSGWAMMPVALVIMLIATQLDREGFGWADPKPKQGGKGAAPPSQST